MCKLIGTSIQLAITQLLLFVDERGGIGCPLRLRLNELMQAGVLWIISPGIVPLNQNLVSLGVGQ